MKLLHWYYDIMNLYGEYGNIAALCRLFRDSAIDCTVDKCSFRDKVTLSDYDFIYIGSGTERNCHVVMADLQRYKRELRAARDGEIPILMTGNAFEMLGQSVTDARGQVHEGLGLYDFTVQEQNRQRLTSDAVMTADFLEQPLVGFINKCSEIHGVTTPLLRVTIGLGNDQDDSHEGLKDHRLYGTHLTGPVLIKNPHFLLWMARQIAGEQAALSAEGLTCETAAYRIALRELEKRQNR